MSEIRKMIVRKCFYVNIFKMNARPSLGKSNAINL